MKHYGRYSYSNRKQRKTVVQVNLQYVKHTISLDRWNYSTATKYPVDFLEIQSKTRHNKKMSALKVNQFRALQNFRSNVA